MIEEPVSRQLGRLDAPRCEPFYFGATGDECLGWLHRPAPGRARRLGVVLCNPIGYEMMCVHRAYRYLATRLAAEGYAALRFEYPSTGDSAGFVDDPDRVAAWLASIRAACTELKAAGGVSQLLLYGLRSGGTLAAAAATEITDLAGFAAWAPFVSGGLLLREFRVLASMNAKAGEASASIAREDGGLRVAGFGLSAQTVRDLETIALTRLPRAPAPRCLILQRDDLPADLRLVQRWQALGSEVRSLMVPGYGAMMRDAFEMQLPLAATETLLEWVQGFDAWPLEHSPVDVSSAPLTVRSQPGGEADVIERPVWFGPSEQLAGVLSEPAQAARRKTAVLFPTVGANHHIGVNRLHVELGRELAALGYPCLRIDISGAGESGVVCERERFWEYKGDNYRDVVEGLRWLKRHSNAEACVLWGICSGAHMAWRAARAESSVKAAMLFNLQIFHWHEDEVADNLARNSAKSLGFYIDTAMKAATWRRLLFGRIDLRAIYEGLVARIRKRLRGRLALFWSRWSERAVAPAQQVARLSRRGCRVSFVCTPEDTGLHEIKTHLGSKASLVTRLPGVEYVEVGAETAADHTFTSVASQRWIKAWTREQLQRHFP